MRARYSQRFTGALLRYWKLNGKLAFGVTFGFGNEEANAKALGSIMLVGMNPPALAML